MKLPRIHVFPFQSHTALQSFRSIFQTEMIAEDASRSCGQPIRHGCVMLASNFGMKVLNHLIYNWQQSNKRNNHIFLKRLNVYCSICAFLWTTSIFLCYAGLL